MCTPSKGKKGKKSANSNKDGRPKATKKRASPDATSPAESTRSKKGKTDSSKDGAPPPQLMHQAAQDLFAHFGGFMNYYLLNKDSIDERELAWRVGCYCFSAVMLLLEFMVQFSKHTAQSSPMLNSAQYPTNQPFFQHFKKPRGRPKKDKAGPDIQLFPTELSGAHDVFSIRSNLQEIPGCTGDEGADNKDTSRGNTKPVASHGQSMATGTTTAQAASKPPETATAQTASKPAETATVAAPATSTAQFPFYFATGVPVGQSVASAQDMARSLSASMSSHMPNYLHVAAMLQQMQAQQRNAMFEAARQVYGPSGGEGQQTERANQEQANESKPNGRNANAKKEP